MRGVRLIGITRHATTTDDQMPLIGPRSNIRTGHTLVLIANEIGDAIMRSKRRSSELRKNSKSEARNPKQVRIVENGRKIEKLVLKSVWRIW